VTPLPQTLMDDYRERLAIPGIPDGGPNDLQDEMPYLLGRAEAYPMVRILEIGVRSGQSTATFLAACTRSAGGGHLWSVDMEVPEVPDWWHGCGYWTFALSRSENLLPEAAGWPGSYHVLFIDGDHTRAGALADLRRFVPYVAPGGVVLVHDTKLFNASEFGMPREVTMALDDFCGEYHLAEPSTDVQRAYRETAETVRTLSWAERGGYWGLGVIEAPNG
jgi:predicted O-methyltransferase YrrM